MDNCQSSKGEKMIDPSQTGRGTENFTPIQDRIRKGKTRKHPQGYSLNVFRGDETLLSTVYGASVAEAEDRADVVIRAFSGRR